MKDAFAKEQKPLESCQAPSFSFYQLIDDLWHQGGNPNPLHRLCTLMRKMKVKSFIREELELNEELLEEQNMAIQRYNQNCRSHRYTADILSVIALSPKMG